MSIHGSMIGNMLIKHASDKINASYLETEDDQASVSNLNKTLHVKEYTPLKSLKKRASHKSPTKEDHLNNSQSVLIPNS